MQVLFFTIRTPYLPWVLSIPSDGRTSFLDSWWVIPTSSSRTFSFSRQSSCLTIRGRALLPCAMGSSQNQAGDLLLLPGHLQLALLLEPGPWYDCGAGLLVWEPV
ncbi:unnamed protein product, partial [Cladocopium goreaui]